MKRVPTAVGRSARLSIGVFAATAALLAGGLVAATSAQAVEESTTFAPTGAEQSYTVPAGATFVTVTVVGAPGAASSFGPGSGMGRVVTADLPVTPGQVLYVEVGGSGAGTTGGFNGGGAGGDPSPAGGYFGGGGGGASDIRTCPVAGPCPVGASLDSRLIVAGGGGGGGITAAGNADTPAEGSIFFPDDGGKAGTLVAGGAGGAPGNDGAVGLPGLYGMGGAGGAGVGDGTPGGGGGGGGFYGGGGGGSGGAGGGGGGGSTFVTASATNVSRGDDAARQPSVTITVHVEPSVTTQPADAATISGESATFTAAASGTPDPSVQWQSSVDGGPWADVAGATGTTLTVDNTTVDMDGTRYRAVFTNSFGGSDHTATSDAATLTVEDPLVITTASLPNGTVGVGYSATLATNDGGSYMWALADGTQLPDGLELSPDGVIEGTPTVAGPVTFTVIVNETSRAELTLTIDPAPVVEPTDPATVPPTDAPTDPSTTAPPTAGPSASETTAPPAAPEAGGGQTLPRTGSDIAPIVSGSALLLLAGLIALVITRLNRRGRRR